MEWQTRTIAKTIILLSLQRDVLAKIIIFNLRNHTLVETTNIVLIW